MKGSSERYVLGAIYKPNKQVFRIIGCAASATFEQLHVIMQAAFQWPRTGRYLFDVYEDPLPAAPASEERPWIQVPVRARRRPPK